MHLFLYIYILIFYIMNIFISVDIYKNINYLPLISIKTEIKRIVSLIIQSNFP